MAHPQESDQQQPPAEQPGQDVESNKRDQWARELACPNMQDCQPCEAERNSQHDHDVDGDKMSGPPSSVAAVANASSTRIRPAQGYRWLTSLPSMSRRSGQAERKRPSRAAQQSPWYSRQS